MDIEEIKKLPYYQEWIPDDRSLLLMAFNNDDRFKVPILDHDKILIIFPEMAHQAVYKAEQSVDIEKDYYLFLLEIINQHLQYPRILHKAENLQCDIANFGYIIEKQIRLFSNNQMGFGTQYLIGTELEYLFYNVRSVYDTLQWIIKYIWEQTSLLDEKIKKKDLPESFRDVILFGQNDEIRQINEIMNKYGLPYHIAEFYFSQSKFFRTIRDIRNKIDHSGVSMNDFPIFQLDEGFAVDCTEKPFSEFDCWVKESIRNQKLGSVIALTSYIALTTINATTDFSKALISCIHLPPPIGLDWHVFVRNPYNYHLNHLNEYINSPWF